MAYSDFTLEEIELKFGIRNQISSLFSEVQPLTPSLRLQESLQTANELPIRSGKAKSELIVLPILLDLRARNDKFFTIYSGDQLTGDRESGLVGECDFILAKDIKTFDINYPFIQVVEAKKNDIEIGVPQCTAQLIGARIFNERKGVQIPKIYGCVTTGNEWLFMMLEDNTVFIDSNLLYLTQVETILGTFQQIIDYYKKILA